MYWYGINNGVPFGIGTLPNLQFLVATHRSCGTGWNSRNDSLINASMYNKSFSYSILRSSTALTILNISSLAFCCISGY